MQLESRLLGSRGDLPRHDSLLVVVYKIGKEKLAKPIRHAGKAGKISVGRSER